MKRLINVNAKDSIQSQHDQLTTMVTRDVQLDMCKYRTKVFGSDMFSFPPAISQRGVWFVIVSTGGITGPSMASKQLSNASTASSTGLTRRSRSLLSRSGIQSFENKAEIMFQTT